MRFYLLVTFLSFLAIGCADPKYMNGDRVDKHEDDLTVFFDDFYDEENFEKPKEKYNRDDWPHWIDEDDDCQNTRAEVLIRDSVREVRFRRSNRCYVIGGMWNDPYTGKTYRSPGKVQIDHLVPLKIAHYSGGAYWTKSQKRTFANDTENLITVGSRVNRHKGAKAPGKWKPHINYWCEYAQKWRHVKNKYNLFISSREDATLKTMEASCNYQIQATNI